MREKEERNNEGRERRERMRDNIFDESPLNISKPAIPKFQIFSERAALFYKSTTLLSRRVARSPTSEGLRFF